MGIFFGNIFIKLNNNMSDEKEQKWHDEYQAHDKVEIDYINNYVKLPKVEDSFPDGVMELPMPTPEEDPLILIHMPTNGGYYLSQVLSCSDSLFGADGFNIIKDKVSVPRVKWGSYNHGHHQSIHNLHSRDVDFETIINYKRVILIEYTFTIEEKKLIQARLNHLKTDAMVAHGRSFANLQVKYHKILQNFMRENHKTYHRFPFTAYLDSKSYAIEVNKALDYLGFAQIENNKVVDLHKLWRKTNARHQKYVLEFLKENNNFEK